MWCPNCLTEYEADKNRCDACGLALVERRPDEPPKPEWNLNFAGNLTKKWPQDAGGNPELPALLTHCSGLNMEDKIIINLLDAFGIPVLRNLPLNGCFGKIVLGISGDGADIFVPASLLEDAKALLEAENEPDPYESR